MYFVFLFCSKYGRLSVLAELLCGADRRLAIPEKVLGFVSEDPSLRTFFVLGALRWGRWGYPGTSCSRLNVEYEPPELIFRQSGS